MWIGHRKEIRKVTFRALAQRRSELLSTDALHDRMFTYYLLTESEVITGKSQTEALMYWPSDSEVNTWKPRSEISL